VTRLRPYAKAIGPFVVSLVAVAVQWLATGTYDQAELNTQLTGIVCALISYWLPNRRRSESPPLLREPDKAHLRALFAQGIALEPPPERPPHRRKPTRQQRRRPRRGDR
jgi:hypothetical protein